MALNRPNHFPTPKNYSSVVFGFDKHPKQTAYYQDYVRGKSKTMHFPKRSYKLISPSLVSNQYAKNYLASTVQDDYGRMEAGQIVTAFNTRKKELKDITEFNWKSSVLLDESAPLNDAVPPSKTIQNIEYLGRQHLLPHCAAIQGPRNVSIPFYPYPMEVSRIASRQTEYTHQYQWPSDDRTGIHQNYFKKKGCCLAEMIC